MINKLDIPLVRDTIDLDTIKKLVGWLETNPKLTKSDLTIEFEKKWSEYLGKKYSVYVNSGSSANLLMIYALLQSKKLKNNKIILPAVSWTTTVTPAIQFGMDPILCECDKDTLGLDIKHLEELVVAYKPSVIMLVHILGFPNKMQEILDICKKYDVILLEDSCESIGSTYNSIKTGNFGLMSTFSFFYGHHMSTIEGGMISTDDYELYKLLVSLRSHGWDRDLDEDSKRELRTKYNVNDFRALYTFYYPAFNLRSTDLQAFIGLQQLEKINDFSEKRYRNYLLYQQNIKNNFWKIKDYDNCFYSNFAYPIIHPKIKELVSILDEYNVASRPLVCGSIGKQPYWVELYGEEKFDFADVVHYNGLYLPNNHQLEEEEVLQICKLVNNIIA
jgi:CDP-6-deoxy-D-xylo-4-hexulose-3-dehydrase